MADKVCLWCEKPLPKRRRKYCGDECAFSYWEKNIVPLWWSNAVRMALRRTNHHCEGCEETRYLEVHHIEHLERFEARHNSPKNRQDNLKVLCRDCHEKEHHPKYAAKAASEMLFP